MAIGWAAGWDSKIKRSEETFAISSLLISLWVCNPGIVIGGRLLRHFSILGKPCFIVSFFSTILFYFSLFGTETQCANGKVLHSQPRS